MRNPRTFVAVVVTVIWAAMYAVELFHPAFQVPAGVSSVMLIVVTWLFATDARRNGGRR